MLEFIYGSRNLSQISREIIETLAGRGTVEGPLRLPMPDNHMV